MPKRLTAIILAAAMTIVMSGCGSLFDKEYSSVTDYSNSSSSTQDGKSTVRNYYGLKQAILQLVDDHQDSGVVTFGEYGDISTDITNACWELRTQNALCAYCVGGISYDLNHIVSYEEATVYITYSKTPEEIKQVVKIPYSTGIRAHLETAISALQSKVVLLVENSALNEDGVKNLVSEIYTDDPLCSVNQPQATVYMYSGTGLERLFEVSLSYGGTDSVLKGRMSALSAALTSAVKACTGMDTPRTALKTARYLVGRCAYSPNSGDSTVYDALVTGRADSRGLALTFKALCNKLNIQCSVVYGLQDSRDHYWNIIKVGDDYYHVDVSACAASGYEAGFLRSDKEMWGAYKWDTANYTECHGTLTYAEISS
jgi:uncharacterized protein YceK